MNLRFGLFLVEQGVLTCDQFCGLVKIQQQSAPALSSVALQINAMTIRQVVQVYDAMQLESNANFLDVGARLGILDANSSRELRQAQELMVPTIESLLVDCDLLTSNQVRTLTQHFLRAEQTGQSIATQPTTNSEFTTARPRQPKFQRRPIIVQNAMESMVE